MRDLDADLVARALERGLVTEADVERVRGLVKDAGKAGQRLYVAQALVRERVISCADLLARPEMPRYAYLPRSLGMRVGRTVARGVTFIADRTSPKYAGRLTAGEAARVISGAAGERGTNRDYLASTIRHLDELGIAAGRIHEIQRLVTGADGCRG